MQITLVYATYSNSTALASELLANELTNYGHQVTRLQIHETSDQTLYDAEFVLLASPSWDYHGQQGMPHEDFTAFHDAHPDLRLVGKPFAVMGLGDSSFTFFCGAVDHLTAWFDSYGARSVVEPLKIDQYYFDEERAKTAIVEWAREVNVACQGLSNPAS